MKKRRDKPPRTHDLLHYGAQANLQALCLPHALDAGGLEQIVSLPIRKRAVRRGETRFREGYGLHAVYLITHGVFKTTLVDNAGAPQITGSNYPNEHLGVDAFYSREPICMASTLVDSAVRVMPVHRLDALIHRIPALQATVARILSERLAEHEQLLMIVNRRRADQRVAIRLFTWPVAWAVTTASQRICSCR